MRTRAQIRHEAARLMAFFVAAGAEPVEAAMLQPAGTLLDLYGEDIRARAYVTTDPIRGELMLRPDFTVPVILQHIEAGAADARYTYAGEVFRKQEDDPHRPTEYIQVGLELFDGADPAAADAEVFALISEAVADTTLRAATGDIGVLTAAVEGLSVSPARRAALMRHIWRPRRFRTLIERFAGLRPASPERQSLLAALESGTDVLAAAGKQIGMRSQDEIRTRLNRLVADAAEPPIPAGELDVMDRILRLKERAPEALETLFDIAVDMPAIQDAVGRLARRLDAMAARGVDVANLLFETSYGRTSMEYYDGFVFGLYAEGRPDLPPVATGGRYDALTRVLGRGQSIPAVGGVIRPEVKLLVAEDGQWP
ncbi:MAG: ATP phosphoribosyltransferase regulatory subunit [Pseudomonadota bacterium]